METKKITSPKKSAMAKRIIALILVVALLFTYTPVSYAREGNTGKSHTWSAMLLGSFNGAIASADFSFTAIAVQIAVGLIDLMYYYSDYSNYNRAVIKIGPISISRSQLVSMVASVAANAVAGAASGQSGSQILNSAVQTVVDTIVSSVIVQLLIKSGMDPALAQLIGGLVSRFMGMMWPQDYRPHAKENDGDKDKKETVKDDGKTTKAQLQANVAILRRYIDGTKKELAGLGSSASDQEKRKKWEADLKGAEAQLADTRRILAIIENNPNIKAFTPVQLSANAVAAGLSRSLSGNQDRPEARLAESFKRGAEGIAVAISPTYREGKRTNTIEPAPKFINVPDSAISSRRVTYQRTGGVVNREQLAELRANQSRFIQNVGDMAARGGFARPGSVEEAIRFYDTHIELLSTDSSGQQTSRVMPKAEYVREASRAARIAGVPAPASVNDAMRMYNTDITALTITSGTGANQTIWATRQRATEIQNEITAGTFNSTACPEIQRQNTENAAQPVAPPAPPAPITP